MVAGMACAQSDSAAVKMKRLDDRLSAVEKVVSALPKIGGYINSAYTYDGCTDKNSFAVQQIWLDFKGAPSATLDYRALINFASGLQVLDAYVRYTASPAFSIAAGQGKNPILLENIMHPARWGYINCSQIVRNYLHAGGRDIGVWVCGSLVPRDDYYRWNYMIGVYNGAGINTADDNHGKDVGLRIEYHPAKPLTLSLSAYEGNIGDRSVGKVNRYGASFRYDGPRFMLRTEYMTGIGAYGSALVNRTSQGVYALAGLHVNPYIMPVLKYDYFDENINADGFVHTIFGGGLHCWPTKFLSVEVNYGYNTFSSSLKKEYGRFDAAVSILF